MTATDTSVTDVGFICEALPRGCIAIMFANGQNLHLPVKILKVQVQNICQFATSTTDGSKVPSRLR